MQNLVRKCHELAPFFPRHCHCAIIFFAPLRRAPPFIVRASGASAHHCTVHQHVKIIGFFIVMWIFIYCWLKTVSTLSRTALRHQKLRILKIVRKGDNHVRWIDRKSRPCSALIRSFQKTTGLPGALWRVDRHGW